MSSTICRQNQLPHHAVPSSRREFLHTAGAGFGALAFSSMLNGESFASSQPLAHSPATAKRVIWCFMEGGPSHLDLVDPKPLLNKLSGQPLPGSFDEPITAMGEKGAPLLAAPRTWKRHGESGLWASEWIPENRDLHGRYCRPAFVLDQRHQSCRWCLPNEYLYQRGRATFAGFVG